jgi:uncharacterized protein (DUF983 family)
MVGSVLGRCPACGAPGAFAGPYRLRPRCARCGVVFERDGGTWLGAAALAYAVAVVAMGLFAWATVPGRGLYPGLEFWLAGVAVATVVLVYRPVKGWWLWVTWAAGWVHRDGEDPEGVPRAGGSDGGPP